MANTLKKINFEPGQYNLIKELTIHGVKIQGSLTPFDVPRQAEVRYNDIARQYAIHFVYLTPDEPTKEQKPSPKISLFLGQSSGKLYDIVIRDQDQNSLWNVKLQLIADIKDLAEKSEGANPPNHLKGLNLLVAKKFLEENKEVFSFSE